MTVAVMAMPRSGSAWLAAYFGWLHDPLIERTWDEVKAYGIVDTGAAYNPERAYDKYVAEGKRVFLLLRRADNVFASLDRTSAFEGVTRYHTVQWLDNLAFLAEEKDVPVVWYEDLFGRYSSMHGGEIAEYTREDFDHIRWQNQQHVNVQTDLRRYTSSAFDRYKEWIDAP